MLNMRRTASAVFLVFILSFSLSTLMVSPTNATDEDTWTTMASLPMRQNLGRFATAAVNGKTYVIGEEQVFEFDPTTDTWQNKTHRRGMSSRISFAAAAYKNKIYVMEGWSSYHTEVYDPAKDTYEFAHDNNLGVRGRLGTEANVVDDKIYVIGGARWQGFHSPLAIKAMNWAYDPTWDYWTKMAPIPTAVSGYASAVLDDKIYIIGGHNADGVIDLVQIYDPKTNQWSQGTPIPTGVDDAGSCATTGYASPKRIYVIGGLVLTNNGSQGTNITQIYDPESDSWSIGTSLPQTINPLITLVNVNDILYAIDGSATEKYTPIGYEEPPPSPPPSNPEFPSWIIIPLVIIATLFVIFIWNRKFRPSSHE
jgi:N-acetylneuraminic acid mutarotase